MKKFIFHKTFLHYGWFYKELLQINTVARLYTQNMQAFILYFYTWFRSSLHCHHFSILLSPKSTNLLHPCSSIINQLFEVFTPNDADGDIYGFPLTSSVTQDGGKCWELKSLSCKGGTAVLPHIGYMWEDQNVPGIQALFVVRRICIKPNLVTPKVLPICIYMLALVILSLLEAPQSVSCGMIEM